MMNSVRSAGLTFFVVLVAAGAGSRQTGAPIGENAALRYWAAFSEIQDSTISTQQAKELKAILDGTAPYDDAKFADLIKKNELALRVMSRGTSLRNCDWGIDYGLGPNAPVEYARKALVLGRLNALYSLHLRKMRNTDGEVHALVAGLRFSHDVANGGSLFATLVANNLLSDHLRVIADIVRSGHVTAKQRVELQAAVAELGGGLDWSSAAKCDLDALIQGYRGNPQTSATLARIRAAYIGAIGGKSKVPALNQEIREAPKEVANLIPNIGGILKEKQDLSKMLRQTRSLLE